MILAQAYNPPTQIAGTDSLVQMLHLTGSEAAAGVPTLGVIESLLLLGLGVVFLLYGFKYFKALVVLNCAVIGGLAGYRLGIVSQSQSMPVLFAVAGALVLGALAWPLLRAAVALLGAVSGLLLGRLVWDIVINVTRDTSLVQYRDAASLVGMTALGMLTFISFNPVVMIFTSIQGATMIMAGALSLLLTYGGLQPSIRPVIEQGYLPGVFVACLALVGFVLQHAKGTGGHKKPAAAPKPAAS